MNAGDLTHARWLISHFVRDDEKRLVIASGSQAAVERRVHELLDDEDQRDEFLDQILRLAHGAFVEGGEVELARSLVKLVLDHPVGRAQLDRSEAGKNWAKFAERPAGASSVAPKEPPPPGTLSAASFVKKFRP